MPQIYMQKIVQNALKLYAKKQYKMRQIYMQKTVQNASN